MKYEVKPTLTIHCEEPAEAMRIVQEMVSHAPSQFKVKMRQAKVKPISKTSWTQGE